MRGTIRGTSIEKLYNGLGLENLEKRRWHIKLSLNYISNFEIPLFKVTFQKYFDFC